MNRFHVDISAIGAVAVNDGLGFTAQQASGTCRAARTPCVRWVHNQHRGTHLSSSLCVTCSTQSSAVMSDRSSISCFAVDTCFTDRSIRCACSVWRPVNGKFVAPDFCRFHAEPRKRWVPLSACSVCLFARLIVPNCSQANEPSRLTDLLYVRRRQSTTQNRHQCYHRHIPHFPDTPSAALHAYASWRKLRV